MIRSMLKGLLKAFYLPAYYLYLKLIYGLRGIEGINRVLLRTVFPKYVLSKFGARIGKGTVIYPNVQIHAAVKNYSNLVIGNNCHVMMGCFLDLSDRITVEDTAIIGIRASIITHQNFGNSALIDIYPPTTAPVKIKQGAVISANSTVLKGITIGEFSIAGAGSVVTRDVEPYSVVAGNPAKTIKTLNNIKADKHNQDTLQ